MGEVSHGDADGGPPPHEVSSVATTLLPRPPDGIDDEDRVGDHVRRHLERLVVDRLAR
jgi:hypothetical protein